MTNHTARSAAELREALAAALPKRKLPVKREALVDAMAERIETWKSLDPKVKPHAEKITAAARVADDLKKALHKAERALKRLGIEQDIERAKAEARALRIDTERPPLAGRSPPLDLYLTVWQAQDQVGSWNRTYRRGRGTPKAFSAALTEQLQELCRTRGGLSQYEFNRVLETVARFIGVRNLSTETLRKRKQRGTK